MKYFPLALLLVHSSLMAAGPFIDAGIGYAEGCIEDYPTCSDNPLGIVGVGYQFDSGIIVEIEHMSSIKERDVGLNLLSVRYRLTSD